MASLLKKGRKGSKAAAEAPAVTAAEMAAPAPAPESQSHAPTAEMAPAPTPVAEPGAPVPQPYDAAAAYTPPVGAADFQLPERHIPAEPPPSREPPVAGGGLLNRVLLFSGETTAAERDRIAQEEFQQAIEPVMEYMRAAVPEASSPEEAARILSENQGEITPDPKGGSYVHGDAFDRDARVYYRLLRRDYEKTPRPSEKRSVSPHLHGIYGKLTGTKGW